jgi:anhydro-N-acetylmuramic acid kinase
LISGTSCDAIDAALVDFSEGVIVIAYEQHPLPEDLRAQLKRGPELTAREISALDRALGEAFAHAATELLPRGGDRVAAIGTHGQTIYHHAEEPVHSWQIGDPSIIAQRTGITTVADLRSMDIAAGGQGAPLAPALHAYAFPQRPIAVVNIGGIANVTLLLDDRIIGFDSGPGNTLLDAWSQRHLSVPFDEDGAWAAGGEIDRDVLAALLDDPYFAKAPPKSTGPEYFSLKWLASRLGDLTSIPPQNIQASLTALTAQTIARALSSHSEIAWAYICGGGIHNGTLMNTLAAAAPDITFASTGDFGLDPDCVEAVLFAWLAKRRLDGEPGNIPSVTGASREVVLGAVYEPRVRR